MSEKIKILIVDDEPDIIDCIEMIAGDEYEFGKASNGEQGLREVMSGQYDIVISDMVMPKMNGFQLLEAVRANGVDIPFMFISGNADKEVEVKISNLGAVSLLDKVRITEVKHYIKNSLTTAREIKEIKKSKDSMGDEFLNLVNNINKRK